MTRPCYNGVIVNTHDQTHEDNSSHSGLQSLQKKSSPAGAVAIYLRSFLVTPGIVTGLVLAAHALPSPGLLALQFLLIPRWEEKPHTTEEKLNTITVWHHWRHISSLVKSGETAGYSFGVFLNIAKLIHCHEV